MTNKLNQQIAQELTRKYTMRRRGEWLRGGICPSCGKKEFYTHAENPIILKCGRMNKCGHELHVRDALPTFLSISIKNTPP